VNIHLASFHNSAHHDEPRSTPCNPLVAIFNSARGVALLRLIRPMLPGRRDKRAHTFAHRNQETTNEDVQNLPLGEQILSRPQSVAHDVAVSDIVQNPDEPAKKPELQAYDIDLNQCGPMVSPSRQFVRREKRRKAHRNCTRTGA
jgi:hypothetical protein